MTYPCTVCGQNVQFLDIKALCCKRVNHTVTCVTDAADCSNEERTWTSVQCWGEEQGRPLCTGPQDWCLLDMSFDISWFVAVMGTVLFVVVGKSFVWYWSLKYMYIYTMRRSFHCALCDTAEPCFICMTFEAVIVKIMAFCNVMCCPLVLRTCDDIRLQGIKWAQTTPLNLLYQCTKLQSTTSQKTVILMWVCCFHLCTLTFWRLTTIIVVVPHR